MKETYTVKVLNNDKKQIRTYDIAAYDVQEAHKCIFEKIADIQEEILEITDSGGESQYSRKNGFVI